MAHHHENPPIPRPALWAVAGLMGMSAIAAALGQYAAIGTLRPPAIETPAGGAQTTPIGVVAEPDRSRTLSFLRSENGRVEVSAVAADGAHAPIGVIEPGESSFVANMLRAFDYERRLQGVSPEAPYRVMAWNTGRLAIEDLATARRIELNGFGDTNSKAILSLFTIGEPSK